VTLEKEFSLIILKNNLFTFSQHPRRKEILLDAFACRKMKGLQPGQTPFATTVTQNSDGKSLPPMKDFLNFIYLLLSKTLNEVRPHCLHVNLDSGLLLATTRTSPKSS
jgi:hypothetical protein